MKIFFRDVCNKREQDFREMTLQELNDYMNKDYEELKELHKKYPHDYFGCTSYEIYKIENNAIYIEAVDYEC